jgi:hypothetical protein
LASILEVIDLCTGDCYCGDDWPLPTLSGHSDRHSLNGRFQGATAIHFFEAVVNSSV